MIVNDSLGRLTVKMVVIALSLGACALGCGGDEAAHPSHVAPATVSNPVNETALASVRLTPQAAARLGIETARVQRRAVARRRTLGGTVAVPSGGQIVLSAPQSGTILAPEGHVFPTAGEVVVAGEPLMELLTLPGSDLSSAGRDVVLAEIRAKIADANAERVAKLLADGAQSERADQEAQAERSAARATLDAARARLNQLRGTGMQPASGSLTALVLTAPHDGVVTALHVGRGQAVGPSQALLEVVAMDPLWVRVPVFVGELADIAHTQPAEIRRLGDTEGAPIIAEPAVAPALADAATSSADLVYSVSASESARLRPGERVSVSVMLAGDAERLVVANSAIIYDVHGGAWLYAVSGENVYERRRVDVDYVDAEWAILRRGPEVGTNIVTVAVAELYGTEFGAGK